MDSTPLDHITRALFAQLKGYTDSGDPELLACPRCRRQLEPMVFSFAADAADGLDYQHYCWSCPGARSGSCLFPMDIPKAVCWGRRTRQQADDGVLPPPRVELLPERLRHLYPRFFNGAAPESASQSGPEPLEAEPPDTHEEMSITRATTPTSIRSPSPASSSRAPSRRRRRRPSESSHISTTQLEGEPVWEAVKTAAACVPVVLQEAPVVMPPAGMSVREALRNPLYRRFFELAYEEADSQLERQSLASSTIDAAVRKTATATKRKSNEREKASTLKRKAKWQEELGEYAQLQRREQQQRDSDVAARVGHVGGGVSKKRTAAKQRAAAAAAEHEVECRTSSTNGTSLSTPQSSPQSSSEPAHTGGGGVFGNDESFGDPEIDALVRLKFREFLSKRPVAAVEARDAEEEAPQYQLLQPPPVDAAANRDGEMDTYLQQRRERRDTTRSGDGFGGDMDFDLTFGLDIF